MIYPAIDFIRIKNPCGTYWKCVIEYRYNKYNTFFLSRSKESPTNCFIPNGLNHPPLSALSVVSTISTPISMNITQHALLVQSISKFKIFPLFIQKDLFRWVFIKVYRGNVRLEDEYFGKASKTLNYWLTRGRTERSKTLRPYFRNKTMKSAESRESIITILYGGSTSGFNKQR